MTQPPPQREFSDEEIAAIEAEMERLKVDDVLLQTLVTLINLGARKAGLATPPGEQGPKADLEQTKQAIDGARALIALLEPRHGQELGQIKAALSQLQMAYARLAGEAGTVPPPGGGSAPTGADKPPPRPDQGPARPRDGGLWVPPGSTG